jgi:glycosyltransferase involved in cell wall biosynthesis
MANGSRGPTEPAAAGAGEAPLVSLLLPNRNNDLILEQCLEGLERHTTYSRVEVIVVDDGSTDASREILRRWRESGRLPGMRVVEQPPSGVVEALNNALETARGEVCVQLDADAVLETPGWIERMLALLAIDERVGVVTAKIVKDTGQLDACGIGVVQPEGLCNRPASITEPAGRRRWHWRMAPPREGSAGAVEHEAAEVDAGIGVCMMYRREDAVAAGGYDPGYAPVWFDDIDLCLSIRAGGKKVFFTPEVRLIHRVSAPRSSAAGPRLSVSRRALMTAGRSARELIPAALQRRLLERTDLDSPHSPEQQQRLLDHYAYWRSKWGWDLLNPDLDEIARRWGDSEIWWAKDPARRAEGEAILASYRAVHSNPLRRRRS